MSNVESNKGSSIFQISGIFSNQEIIKTMIFEYATGYKTGLLVANIRDKSLVLFILKKDLYTSFWNKHDYFMAEKMY